MFVVDFSEYLGELADEVGMADFGDVHITVAELASIGEDAGPVIDTIMMAPAPHTPPLRMSFERDGAKLEDRRRARYWDTGSVKTRAGHRNEGRAAASPATRADSRWGWRQQLAYYEPGHRLGGADGPYRAGLRQRSAQPAGVLERPSTRRLVAAVSS